MPDSRWDDSGFNICASDRRSRCWWFEAMPRKLERSFWVRPSSKPNMWSAAVAPREGKNAKEQRGTPSAEELDHPGLDVLAPEIANLVRQMLSAVMTLSERCG